MPWSLSRLRTFETCPAKYEYRYLQKIAQGEPSAAAARGSSIHKAIEVAVKTGGDLPEEAGHLVNSYINMQRMSGNKVYPEYDLKLDHDWKMIVAGPYWYHGILDLFVLGDKIANVDDWKSGKMYPSHDDDKEMYALAVFCAYPEVEEVVTQYHYMDLGKVVPKVFHRPMVEPAQERWTRRVHRMEQATEFIPKPQYGCRYCDYSKAKGGPCRF